MFDLAETGSTVEHVLDKLSDAIDELVELDLTRLDADELLDLLRGIETQRRRIPVADHRLIAELDERGIAGEFAARDTRTMLRDALRLSPHEAKRRVRAAVDLGPRRTVTGERLGPLFPDVAAAQAAGVISEEHAKVVIRGIDELPVAVQVEHGADVEARLVGEARRFDPSVLARLARHVVDVLDPDGTLADDADHERRRTATLSGNRDGSGELHAHLTPAAFAQWQAVLDPLAAPRPSDADGEDPRSAGQRMHDALADTAVRLLASGTLPATGGSPATVLLTMTLDQLENRTGLVTTAHSGAVSVADALRIAGEAQVVPVVIDNEGVLAFGQGRRVASTGQRLALAARDGGCCFPGCDAPPGWAQAHHVLGWIDGGSTDLDNLCLLCGYHHREFEKRGWTVVMKEGLPWWTPPPRIDPEQAPIRNAMHDRTLQTTARAGTA
jgi:hypothetical protein